MQETELKFQVPAERLAGVRRAVATGTAQRTRLQAMYAETADHRLARAGLALRLRKQGRVWVQTLKGRGDGLLQRLEHEVALPAQRGTPQLDPARHAGTPAGDALAAALSDGAALQTLYRTDIQRTHRVLRRGGARVELALDEGWIIAGRQRIAVCELELELLDGPPRELLALAEAWVQRHGLWLDVRTKSERGFRLATGLQQVPAVKAGTATLNPQGTPREAFAAMLQATLQHAWPNAAELAGGSGTPEHLHQLRVALRRLRTVLRVFADWAEDPEATSALEAAWAQTFAQLGTARDDDALAALLLPALAAAGGPPLTLPRQAAAQDPAALLRAPAITVQWLRTLQMSLPSFALGQQGLREAARRTLRRLARKALSEADAFADAPVELQHRLRKRLKRLRYAAEFVLPLVPAKAAARGLNRLRQVLDEMGHYNDVLVAQERLQQMDASDPGVAFALGWLASQRALRLARCAQALKELTHRPGPWS